MVGGELRAPLASLGRALRATTDPAKAGAVRTAARALSAVAREARVAARFVAVTPDTGGRRVDLGHLVAAAVNAVADEARAKGVDVESAVEPDGVEVAGDRRRLRQAAQRVLETAVRSTPAGGRVRARLSRAGAHAVLAVSMVGASVAPTAGLRLSVARQLVEHHGGVRLSRAAGPAGGACGAARARRGAGVRARVRRAGAGRRGGAGGRGPPRLHPRTARARR